MAGPWKDGGSADHARRECLLRVTHYPERGGLTWSRNGSIAVQPHRPLQRTARIIFQCHSNAPWARGATEGIHGATSACDLRLRRAYRRCRRRGRVAEGGGLLNRYRVVKPYRGFESLRLRQHRRTPATGCKILRIDHAISQQQRGRWHHAGKGRVGRLRIRTGTLLHCQANTSICNRRPHSGQRSTPRSDSTSTSAWSSAGLSRFMASLVP